MWKGNHKHSETIDKSMLYLHKL